LEERRDACLKRECLFRDNGFEIRYVLWVITMIIRMIAKDEFIDDSCNRPNITFR
jgi:hypothetical protein